MSKSCCRLLGGSWVVVSGVISRVNILITHIRGLITLLITTVNLSVVDVNLEGLPDIGRQSATGSEGGVYHVSPLGSSPEIPKNP